MLRAGGAGVGRRARRVSRCRDPAAGAAQGHHARDGQPRHRLGPPGLPGAGAGAHRLPDRVPHRHARDRHPPPRVRRLGALARRPAHPAQRVDGGRPAGRDDDLRPDEPPRARHPHRGPGRGGLRGDDRRGERAGRGDGRQPDQGEEADQHALVGGRGVRAADARPVLLARALARVHRRRRVRGGDPQGGAAAQGDPRAGDPGAPALPRPRTTRGRAQAPTP